MLFSIGKPHFIVQSFESIFAYIGGALLSHAGNFPVDLVFSNFLIL